MNELTFTFSRSLFNLSKQRKNNFVTLSIFRYFCEEEFCQNGLFIPPQCEDRKCGTLLADFPGILHKYSMIIHKSLPYLFRLSFSEVSREEASSALVDLILEYELFIMVAYLGPNLVKVVNFMERYAVENIPPGTQISRIIEKCHRPVSSV